MKVRPAGSMMTFSEAMARCVEMPATMTALLDHLKAQYWGGELTADRVKIERYSFDGRPEWNGWVWLVTVDGLASVFTDTEPQ